MLRVSFSSRDARWSAAACKSRAIVSLGGFRRHCWLYRSCIGLNLLRKRRSRSQIDMTGKDEGEDWCGRVVRTEFVAASVGCGLPDDGGFGNEGC
jgi:hypothetical protein